EFSEDDALPAKVFGTSVYQTDDGTLFNYRSTPESRLHVKWKGEEVEVAIPELYQKFSDTEFTVYGNTLYFVTKERKIFKATFSSSALTIDVSFDRQLRQDEDCEDHLLQMSTKTGTLVYRMCDDPERDGILLDVKGVQNWKLLSVHRGKIIVYKRNANLATPYAAKLNATVIIIEGLKTGRVCARDSSPFVYMIYGKQLRVLDTRTVEFLPTLSCDWKGRSQMELLGVQGRVITVLGWIEMMTAKLPAGYFKNEPEYELTVAKEKLTEMEEMILKYQTLFEKQKKRVRSLEMDIDKDKLADEQQEQRRAVKRSANAMAVNSKRTISEFTVDKIIGIGSYGCVLKATFIADNRDFALKSIPLKRSANLNKKALDEILRMALLDHDGIVQYHYSWVEHPQQDDWEGILPQSLEHASHYHNISAEIGGYIFIQMELCEQSLAEWLRDHMDMKLRKLNQIRAWFKQLVDAVEFIHRHVSS
ncbi:hypothetical protein PENTCL1PPCAC_9049, partial [Pristionchus entomophagus]